MYWSKESYARKPAISPPLSIKLRLVKDGHRQTQAQGRRPVHGKDRCLNLLSNLFLPARRYAIVRVLAMVQCLSITSLSSV